VAGQEGGLTEGRCRQEFQRDDAWDENGGLSDVYLKAAGGFCVSIFDHWLSLDEAEASAVMSHGGAKALGGLAGYMAGERKFLKFYRSLCVGGVWINDGRKLDFTPGYNLKSEKLFTHSLRDRRLMDVIFPESGVRVVGGYDRTDTVVPLAPGARETAAARAAEAGLHILDLP
jgi:hypothetical protein